MKLISTVILIATALSVYGQNKVFDKWTEKEKKQYQILTELAKYVNGKDSTELSKKILFDKYVELNYVLKDTSEIHKKERLKAFDGLFYYFRKTVDSIGLKNLDAKPVRFYKNHKIYEPFDKDVAMESISGKKMYTQDSNVFAYYQKKEPEEPLGTLLFDPETDKLVAWIMLKQGRYKYFLTFNLF
ncbi:hypothetical protein [Arenibacter sp. ARW7G5Y1]|uniref:hypothetical protein n=1 Tax=Arenibacter sp. ARW7G5Y1 TaxID=2135619 RepID=UPI000D75D537|nr:hypothetical protein [Arenibacter sp. ARW7G5Y1]PXX25714.1 hypothetical protein C7972_111132 [Arenibacter sp. ARW7G5Y1]